LEENRELKKQICVHTKEAFPPLPHPSIIRKKNITRDNIDGKYHVEGNKFEKIRGTREEVWCGTAYQTTGELKKIDLELNKHGKIVSKIKLITARLTNNFVNKRES
jgi:hypothetical protein